MYTCQYCSKVCKNSNSLRNHERLCKDNPNRQTNDIEAARAAISKTVCPYCSKIITGSFSAEKHIKACKKNPENFKTCPVCRASYSKSGATCSYACANTYFKSGVNNPNWKDSRYKTTCFAYHDKVCIVCGESKIVEVHHVDENHDNNSPNNLVPLCPTHHQYYHSRYKDEVAPIISAYITSFNCL